MDNTTDSIEQRERTLFEAHMREDGWGDWSLSRSEMNGLYADGGVQRFWKVWKARAALSAPAIPTWQPIETAPKDGSKFIGLRGNYVARTSFGRHYIKFPHEPEGPTYRDVWNEVGRDFIAPWEPSHWMPLHAAQIPADQEGAK